MKVFKYCPFCKMETYQEYRPDTDRPYKCLTCKSSYK